MKKALLFLLLISYSVSSQEMSVAPSGKVTVKNGASLNVSGLKLTPSSDYEISGANDVTYSDTNITGSGGNSIDRVYSTTNALAGFVGIITFYYEDGELNGVTEITLKLQVKDDTGAWTSYSGIVDETNNTITYDFTSAIDFTAVTASADGVTLAIENIDLNLSFSVFPNPTANKLFITSDRDLSVEAFNKAGQSVLTSKSKTLDLSYLASGIYFFLITDIENHQTHTYKIIKN